MTRLIVWCANGLAVQHKPQWWLGSIGVAPMNRDSGTWSGKRRIRGGRHRVRTVMFMAMLSSIQCNPVFKRFYEHLKTQGKLPKVAIIACMRKLIVVLNTLLKNEEVWCQKTA